MSMKDLPLSERLGRLVESGLRSQDALEYTTNLKELAEEVARAKDEIKRMSRVFRALSHPTRLKILKLLSAREMCVCEIMAILNATQPTTSHHLNILKNMGLVEERREGKWVVYSISDSKLSQSMIKLLSYNH